MPREPFDPEEEARFRPADPRTQEELGGVLERAFARERGHEPDEEENRRLHAWADEALAESETRLRQAREAEAAMKRAAERYGHSGEPADLAEAERWKMAAESYRRKARELRVKAETLRQNIV